MTLNRKSPLLAIVGAGRVGATLGRLLHKRGWRIGAIVTRSMKTARDARRGIGAGDPQPGISAVLLDADVILIATPDRAIAETARRVARLTEPGNLSQTKQMRVGNSRSLTAWHGKVILHTSGALGSGVLAPLSAQGAHVGSLHPLQTFTGRTGPMLAGAICAIEGSPAALRVARAICRSLGCVPIVLSARNKAAYHAGAALAAGHVLAVMEAAVRMLVHSGFSQSRAIRALLPLTRQTLANYERTGAQSAWTGPLKRDDFAIIEGHLEALRRFPPEYREAYEALSSLGVNVLSDGSRSKKRQLEQVLARQR